MKYKLAKNWEEIQSVLNTIEDRKSFLLSLNKKYYSLILKENLFSSSQNYDLVSEYELMEGTSSSYIYNGEPTTYKKTYVLDFYGVSLDFLVSMNSEIITNSIGSSLGSDYELEVTVTQGKNHYITYESEPYRISVITYATIYITRQYVSLPAPHSSIDYHRWKQYPLDPLYSKLILNFKNARNFF